MKKEIFIKNDNEDFKLWNKPQNNDKTRVRNITLNHRIRNDWYEGGYTNDNNQCLTSKSSYTEHVRSRITSGDTNEDEDEDNNEEDENKDEDEDEDEDEDDDDDEGNENDSDQYEGK